MSQYCGVKKEYARLSKELRLRRDEIINLRLEMPDLEIEEKLKANIQPSSARANKLIPARYGSPDIQTQIWIN